MAIPSNKTGSGRALNLRPGSWRHWLLVFVVFGITGSLTVLFSRFLLQNILNLQGGLISGPWSYRAVYLVLIPPFYSLTLVTVGTVLGKGDYFRARVVQMWLRLLPARLRRRLSL